MSSSFLAFSLIPWSCCSLPKAAQLKIAKLASQSLQTQRTAVLNFPRVSLLPSCQASSFAIFDKQKKNKRNLYELITITDRIGREAVDDEVSTNRHSSEHNQPPANTVLEQFELWHIESHNQDDVAKKVQDEQRWYDVQEPRSGRTKSSCHGARDPKKQVKDRCYNSKHNNRNLQPTNA